jgi:hypothetical protein
MPPIKPNGTVLISATANASEYGKHGACVITRATLTRPDGTSSSLTPTSAIMREEATATSTPWSGTVAGTPSAGTGTSGKATYTITVASTSGLAGGQYVRSQASGLGGVYQVDTVLSGTQFKIFCAPGELDIATGATVERVTPEGWYRGTVPVLYTDLLDQACDLEIEVDLLTNTTRTSTYPVFTSASSPRKYEILWPEPIQVEVV